MNAVERARPGLARAERLRATAPSPMRALKLRGLATWAVAGLLLYPARALAGPPFVTDDPEPIEHRHWELYLASQTVHDRDGWSGTAPHFEANYGVVPNVQLHVIAPFAYFAATRGSTHYGYGDMELGAKIRFVREGAWVPQIGTYPMLEAPTGSQRDGLGNGSAQVFLPIWLQKSFGEWTTYGGPGLWMDVGHGDRRSWYFGWELQRRIVEHLSLGAEVFYLTPKEPGDEHDLRFNVGAIIDVNDSHHFLVSAGRGLVGPTSFQGYFAYLVTLGPSCPEP